MFLFCLSLRRWWPFTIRVSGCVTIGAASFTPMWTGPELEMHHTFVPHVVTVCAILHNICLCAGDTVAPEDDLEEDVGDDEGEPGSAGSLAGPTVC
ncbi:hypothetical protein OJAV_G00234600 [Oryzias javanicus]|uniref:DDE Tnp4 domain-containing protein n=1 Tax=Oryzias javanicus TaxID=123683 RepID=A0A437BYQ1_ORYJA|nr:hypothetical protein OJAV_G00234600 [Oryzias javanicus]